MWDVESNSVEVEMMADGWVKWLSHYRVAITVRLFINQNQNQNRSQTLNKHYSCLELILLNLSILMFLSGNGIRIWSKTRESGHVHIYHNVANIWSWCVQYISVLNKHCWMSFSVLKQFDWINHLNAHGLRHWPWAVAIYLIYLFVGKLD